jgi:hypothetical protein
MYGDHPLINPSAIAATFVRKFTQGHSLHGCFGLVDQDALLDRRVGQIDDFQLVGGTELLKNPTVFSAQHHSLVG